MHKSKRKKIKGLPLSVVSIVIFAGFMSAILRFSSAESRTPKLLFNAIMSDNSEIYYSTLDGKDVHQITDDGSYDSWWPQASPDGKRLVFNRTPRADRTDDSYHHYEHLTIWMSEFNTSTQQWGSPHKIVDKPPNGGIQGHIQWAPDGSKLLWVRTNSSGSSQLNTINKDGSNMRQISNRALPVIDAAWMPDSNGVLYIGCPSSMNSLECGLSFNNKNEVFTARLDSNGMANTNAETRLTNDDIAQYDAFYSPNGSTISYLEVNYLNIPWASDSKLMDANGSNQRTLLNGIVGQEYAVNAYPIWYDDSTLYVARANSGNWDIFRIKSNGNSLTCITCSIKSNRSTRVFNEPQIWYMPSSSSSNTGSSTSTGNNSGSTDNPADSTSNSSVDSSAGTADSISSNTSGSNPQEVELTGNEQVGTLDANGQLITPERIAKAKQKRTTKRIVQGAAITAIIVSIAGIGAVLIYQRKHSNNFRLRY